METINEEEWVSQEVCVDWNNNSLDYSFNIALNDPVSVPEDEIHISTKGYKIL